MTTPPNPRTHWWATDAEVAPCLAEDSAEARRFGGMSQGALFWWRFRKHRLAVLSMAFLALLYLVVAFAEVVAPYGAGDRNSREIHMPPQGIHLLGPEGLTLPYVHPYFYRLDRDNLRRVYTPDTARIQPLRFFCLGKPYRFWGLFPGRFHLVCPPEGASFHPLGTDRLGRDVFSRIIHGARISLTVGLLGIALSMTLGMAIGGIAGYKGGVVDLLIQRMIELFRCLPELPLWMALSAALPVTWSPIAVYFGITLILGLLDWPGLARSIRGKLLSLREEDFVLASRMMGAPPGRIIRQHLLPALTSHLIASATLSIPGMILGETALSFIGLGLRPPVTSWGVLLNEAGNLNAVLLHPWLLTPVIPVILTVLTFNFMGDGLRDAADPYMDS
jgi:peptide/nickel transport system permease protein